MKMQLKISPSPLKLDPSPIYEDEVYDDLNEDYTFEDLLDKGNVDTSQV